MIMKNNKKYIPLLIIVFIFAIYFIGKNVRFENNVLKIGHLAGSLNDVKDPNLRACMEANIPAGQGPETVTTLDCSNKDIYSLEGIEYFSELTTLRLNNNYIKDLSPVNHLSKLNSLSADHNMIEEFDLGDTILNEIQINYNYISDITKLTFPNTVTSLHLNSNKISGNINLSGLGGLWWLNLGGNKITSLKIGTPSLVYLVLSNNPIKSVDDILVGNKTLAESTESGEFYNNKLQYFVVNGIPWSNSTKKIISNNIGVLKDLQIGNSKMEDYEWFNENTSNFTSLETLNISGLNADSFDLTNLNLKTLYCDGSNATNNFVENKINKTTIENLHVPNNKITAFHAQDYPTLKQLNISGNPLANFEGNTSTSLKDVDISHVSNYQDIITKLNASVIEKLTLVNDKLTDTLDFSAFSELRELYLHNTVENGNSNNIKQINISGLNNLEVLDISRNKDFNNIIANRYDAGATYAPLSFKANFTSLASLDLSTLKNLKELSVVGCTSLTTLDLSPVINGLERVSIALSGLPNNYVIPSSDTLRMIFVNVETPSLLRLADYKQLGVIRVASKGSKAILSSKDTSSIDNIKSLLPNNITNPKYEEVYSDFSDASYRRIQSIPSYLNKVHYKAKEATITNLYGFNGVTGYDGYYDLTNVKITSVTYKFDDDNKLIIVGDDTDDKILENISLNNNNAKASIEDGKLVVKFNDEEIARYTISHVDPDKYNASTKTENEIIDDDNTKKSLDPTTTETNNYDTIENPNTGVILSFIVLVVLIAVGIVTKYYLYNKRKNTELIEKV